MWQKITKVYFIPDHNCQNCLLIEHNWHVIPPITLCVRKNESVYGGVTRSENQSQTTLHTYSYKHMLGLFNVISSEVVIRMSKRTTYILSKGNIKTLGRGRNRCLHCQRDRLLVFNIIIIAIIMILLLLRNRLQNSKLKCITSRLWRIKELLVLMTKFSEINDSGGPFIWTLALKSLEYTLDAISASDWSATIVSWNKTM